MKPTMVEEGFFACLILRLGLTQMVSRPGEPGELFKYLSKVEMADFSNPIDV